MQSWMLPTLGAFLLWGFWAFIPKVTTQHIDSQSAIVYEVLGGLILGAIVLTSINFQLNSNPIGISLAMLTGLLGAGGAFCFLNAVSQGPVALVASLSALYPVISIFLANLILHETITLQQSIGIGLALLAVILVTA